MKVLHVIARLPRSGTELQLEGFLKAANDEELWQPTLCPLYRGYPLVDDIEEAGVLVERSVSQQRDTMSKLHALHKLIMSKRYDLVHSSLWGASAFTRFAVATCPKRPAMVISERRVEDFRSKPKRLIDRALSMITDGYIGNSGAVVKFIERAHRVPRQRIHQVNNGIDRSIFYPRAGERTPGVMRLGAIGRLVEQKGFDILIEAVDAARCNMRVSIVGAGELDSLLKAKAKNLPIDFLGAIKSRRDIAEFLRQQDVLVMPSRYEGMPNALLEARACGLSIIATDVPGIREVAGPDTVLVRPDAPAELAHALCTAAAETLNQRSAISVDVGEQGTMPTFDVVARQHLAVFESSLHRRRGVQI